MVETVRRIRRVHAGRKPIKAISRDLQLSRKVVRKATRAPQGAFDYHRAVLPRPRPEPLQDRLDTLLAYPEKRTMTVAQALDLEGTALRPALGPFNGLDETTMR